MRAIEHRARKIERGWRMLPAILVLGGLPGSVLAQNAESDEIVFDFWHVAPLTEPLVTDRPDFTESTDAVPLGHFQLEMGYTFTYDRESKDRIKNHTAPEMLLRIGIAQDLELRLDWAGYSWTEMSSEIRTRRGRRVSEESWSESGEDFALGFKVKLWDQDGWLPHFGILGSMGMPTGSRDATAGDVVPKLGLLWAYDVTEAFSVAGNVNFEWPIDGGERFFQTSASLSLAVVLTERVGVYLEYFGFYPNAEDTDMAHSMNSGFTYLINDNFQIDLRVGLGLNEEADDFFSGIGFAWRI